MNRRSTSIFTAVVIFLLLVFSLQPARASTWTHQVVDNSATTTGKNLSVAVDPAGKLYLGYLDTTSTAPILKYATNAGGSWSSESLDKILPDALGASTATVFTPGGPRIMAYSYNTNNKKYMYRSARKVTGDGWQLQDIGGGISPLDGSIQPAMTAVDAGTQTGATQYMGFTYITYNDGAKLWYANERDMKWYNITASGNQNGKGGAQSDLAIDRNGNVHVIYVDSKNNLFYKMNPVDTSAFKLIQNVSSKLGNPSIGIDNTTTSPSLHVVYTASDGYAYYISSVIGSTTWTSPVQIGPCGSNSAFTSVKMDSMNNVHVAWYNSTTGKLMYNEKLASNGTWTATTVGDTITYPGNTSTNYGQYAALAIDQYNNVNIAYYDATSTSLDVVTKPGPAIDASPSTVLFGYVAQYGTSAPQTVTISNKGNSNLTINSVGDPSLTNFTVVSNSCAPLPKILAADATCSVSYQFAPNIPGAQTATVSIGSTDPTNPTKLVTLNGTATPPGSHTITAGPFGPGGTVSPAGLVAVTNGLSQTFTFTPDPGYLVGMVMIDPVFADPQHPTMQEMGAASKGALTSYTFDYTDTGNHTLYVYFTPYASVSTWKIDEVDNTGSATGSNCSIAVDPNNKLHIGYLDTSTSGATFLKYATNATSSDGSWSLTSLRDILPNAFNASTATVYTPGGPRIMAYSYDTATLAYKYQAARLLPGNAWQLQDIGGGISPLDGSVQPNMTTVSTSTQTGALQYTGFTFITFNNGNYLQYANERDMRWYPISSAGSASGNGGTQSDLTIDSSGNIHVIYVDALNKLMYAKNPIAPGQAATVTKVTGTISNPNITIDSNNKLHIIYLDATDHNVKYINKDSAGTWSDPKIVGPAGSYGGYLGIKADNANGLHITYYYGTTTTTGLLMYQHVLPSGAWSSEEVIKDPNNSTNYGQYNVIAIDHDNIVNIAYYDTTRTSLKIATKQTFAIEASPSPLYFGNVQQGSTDENTVTVTNNGTAGNLHIRGGATISGTNASDFAISTDPAKTTCTNGLTIAPGAAGCKVTVVFTPSATGARAATLTIGSDDLMIPYKSVPLSGTSNPSTNYTINAGVYGVGGTISEAGPVTVAGGANKTFTFTPDPGYLVAFVAVDPQGMTQQDMMAASQGSLTSYTFNQVTQNHTIYVFFTQAIPVTSWNITEVDNSATNTGKYCSITNDLNGKLYVGYLDTTSATAPLLKYATNRNGSWSYETVNIIPNITTAGTATVFSEGIGPRVMAYSYNSALLPQYQRKYAAARKWTETPMPGGNLNDWQLQYIAGDIWPTGTPNAGQDQNQIYNTTTDTFTGATQHNGFTFITYTDGNNLWYANEKDFYFAKLDPANSIAGAGKQSDLVLDSDSNIHIIYYTPGASGTGELRYGTGQGSNSAGYTETPIMTGATTDPSITIDGNKMLHVSYIKAGRVYYLNKPFGGSWSSTPKDIGPCGVNGAYTSIKANGLNIVHLTYYAYNSTNASGKLMYVNRTPEGVWSAPQAVTDTSANVGQYAALTVDMHHNVNIAYYDVTRSSLKVAARMIPVISAPSSVNYGTVNKDTTHYQTINVSNLGQDDLRIGTATIDGVNASNFWIDSNTCKNTTLIAGGAGCSVTVAFTSSITGAKSATLHITSNDRYTPDQQIALTATVVDGAQLYTIHTSVNSEAGTHGRIQPGGDFSILSGGSQRFDFIKDPGFFIADVKVDGVTDATAIANGYYEFANVTANHTLAVTFASYIKVGTNYIGTLQAAAYEAANTGLPIKARIKIFTEYLIFDLPTNIIFGGGYDSAFTSQDGTTVIRGTLEISDGGIEVQNIGVAPAPN